MIIIIDKEFKHADILAKDMDFTVEDLINLNILLGQTVDELISAHREYNEKYNEKARQS